MDLTNIDLLGIDRVLRRGTGEILEQRADLLLVRDRVSGAYFLACEDPALGLSALDRIPGRDLSLLMTANCALVEAAFERYGFSEKLICRQAAYYGPKPEPDPALPVRPAEARDLPMLLAHYHRISPAELAQVVARGSLLIGCAEGEPVGFAGEHLEGSMGLLYVFPAFRRQGYGAALERRLIAWTMDRGFLPFCQVEQDNLPSLRLQRRLGLTLSDNLIQWMWKE